MIEFIRAFPQAAQLIGPDIARNLDWPGAQDVAKKLQYLVPPELRPPEDGEPPAPSSPPPPDPEKVLAIEKEKIQLEQVRIQLEQERVQLQQELAKLLAKLRKEMAPESPAAADSAAEYYRGNGGGPVYPSKVRWLQ